MNSLAFDNNSQQRRRTPMKNLIGRRELLGAGIGLCASSGAGSALAQSFETAPREPGTDALGRRVGTGGRGERKPQRRAESTKKLFTPPPGRPSMRIAHNQ